MVVDISNTWDIGSERETWVERVERAGDGGVDRHGCSQGSGGDLLGHHGRELLQVLRLESPAKFESISSRYVKTSDAPKPRGHSSA